MYVANQPSNHPLLCCMCSAYHSCSQLCNLPEPESKKMIIAGVLQGIWTPMTSFSETALMKKQSISEFSQENNKQIRSLMFFDVFCCLARFQKRYDNYDTLWYISWSLWYYGRVQGSMMSMVHSCAAFRRHRHAIRRDDLKMLEDEQHSTWQTGTGKCCATLSIWGFMGINWCVQ